jgi:glyoxylase-like metal-dependent hydrolase (beta-lactamase superfamily II)
MSTTNKPLLAIFITHPHYDHFGGLFEIRKYFGEIDIYSTKITADKIVDVFEAQLGRLKEVYGEYITAEDIRPNKILSSNNTIQVSTIKFEIMDFGGGESENHIAICLPHEKALFVGDMIFPFRHYWMAEARIEESIRQLNKLQSTYFETEKVYSGHGEATSMDIIPLQLSYINYAVSMVKNELEMNDSLSFNFFENSTHKMLNKYPAYGVGFNKAFIMKINALGIEKSLRK